MHLIDYVIIGVILTLVLFAIRSIVKRKGKCDGCSGCDQCNICGQYEKDNCPKINDKK